MILETIIVGPLEVNCYLIGCEKTKEVYLVDPGDDLDEIQSVIEKNNYIPIAIINTHGHIDHAGGVKAMMEKLNIPFYLHSDEQPVIDVLGDQGDRFGLFFSGIPDKIEYVSNGQLIKIGDESFRVIHTPGHSPGGICLQNNNVLITGDTLFAGSIGRTDLPGGDYDQIMKSLKEHLMVLDPETQIYPGHGPPSIMGKEIQYNPFLNGTY